MTGLGNRVRIVLRHAGKGNRNLYYERGFVGLTVNQAIKILDGEGNTKEQLPNYFTACPPYYLNGKEVDEHSDIVLEAGDVLSADDP